MLAEDGLEQLTDEECMELLVSADIGRLGVSVGAMPAIFPVTYKMIDGDIVFRIGEGLKLRAVQGAVVSFEVDSLDTVSRAGWSVLVVGVARAVPEEDGGPALTEQVTPWAGGERRHVVVIHPADISGRRISPGDLG